MTTTTASLLLNRVQCTQDEAAISFKVGGTETLAAMEKLQHDEESDFSDLSALENETDDFGRRLLQHSRETREVNGSGGRQVAFKRAKPRPRLAERPVQTDHEVVEKGRLGSDDGSNGGSRSPPLNLPKQWGTRAKRRTDWLRKLHAPTEMEVPLAEQNQDGNAEDEVIAHRRTAFSGDYTRHMNGDWNADENEVGQDTPPSMRRHLPSRIAGQDEEVTSSSLRHLNDTLLDAARDFEDADMLASTPAPALNVNRKNRRIDSLTRRELAALERTQQIASSPLPARNIDTTRPATAPDMTDLSPPKRRRVLLSTVNNKENLPPNGNTSPTFKAAETTEQVSRVRGAEPVTFKNSSRPPHKRNDSYNLLRRLARVSSLSPSPRTNVASRSDDAGGDKDGRPRTSPGHLQSGAPISPPTSPEADERPVPELRIEAPDVDDTPAPQDGNVREAKTPVVTGAWLDTPGPGIDVRPLLKSTDSTIVRAFGSPSAIATLEVRNPMDGDERRVASEPVHGKSALADVLKQVRQADGEDVTLEGERFGMGDDTVRSLEGIVTTQRDMDDGGDETATMTLDLTADLTEIGEASEEGAAMSQQEKDRRQEKLAMEAMNKHLRLARTSIKDANAGLRRVENKMDNATATTSSTITSTTLSRKSATTGDQQPASHEHPCPTCGSHGSGPQSSTFRSLVRDITSAFYTRRTPSRGPRLTYLGLTLLTTLLYLSLESLLCSYLCHPRYAEKMVGYGVNPEAPKFPFVLPTVVARPLKWVWGPVWEVVRNYFGSADVTEPVVLGLGRESVLMREHASDAGSRVFASQRADASSVESVGVYGKGWVKTTTAAVVTATARVMGSVGDAVDEVGSMWDDEFVL
ncbi:hypothetical protein LTR56_002718 [Elasticomyces elasticus]|nr:hypothetical protein LTR56_002718 [Elasticomyces elasticus]KAK3666825.1 hypothetical protein LTR22_002412 [Elasticomyces elasticus]KAK4918849.1 hypothetical protein LTR49_013480 [Elasticomyces elasticus]